MKYCVLNKIIRILSEIFSKELPIFFQNYSRKNPKDICMKIFQSDCILNPYRKFQSELQLPKKFHKSFLQKFSKGLVETLRRNFLRFFFFRNAEGILKRTL